MRTVERLQQIKALDRYIDSQIEQIKRLESQALKVTAGAMQTDMVQGGKRKGKDDIYVELMMAREEVERFTAEAIKQKLDFRRQIAEVELHGKVTGKSMVGKLYTIDCGAYGKFLVSKEQYDSVNVGDDIPSYLKERGN